MTSTGSNRPVVLGVDALAPGATPVVWAADEADRRGRPLRLVHALPPTSQDARVFGAERYREELRERGRHALEEAADAARRRHPDLSVTTAVAADIAAPALCRESAHAALVVLGSRRLNRLEEVLSASSVAVPVSAQAHCPVVVVLAPEPGAGEEPAEPAEPYVVVGVDGSPSSAAAVDFALDFAARRGAALRAVRVRRSRLTARVDEDAAVDDLRRLLDEATAGLPAGYPAVTVTHGVLRGHPVEELAKVAEHALGVVVGRRGRGGFTGMRLGSVPHGLLHRAHCPVVTVPVPPAGGD
ncbi:universal stress protein [Kitasatospora sp. NPDC091207]|uniref:universal stress protein n=1 Tax=Kitasatospora sp. NPDC091207 TaxID=3364083 RepID=UPI00380BA472